MNWWQIHGTLSPLCGCERTTAILTNGNGRGNAKKREVSISISIQHHCKTAKVRLYFFKPLFVGKRSNDKGTTCAHSEAKLEKCLFFFSKAK